MAFTGIVLAGGKSSRMGQDKALLDYQGKRLIDYAIELLTPVCSEILISTNQPGYENLGFQLIVDQYPDCGYIGGLHAALANAANNWDVVIS